MQTAERKSRREFIASRSTSRAAYVRSFTGRNMKFDINGDILFRMLAKDKSKHNVTIHAGDSRTINMA